MKRLAGVYIATIVLIISGMMYLLYQMKSEELTSPAAVDMLEVNRTAHQISDQWDAVVSADGSFIQRTVSIYDFVVFDLEGNCLLRTRDDLPDTKAEAVQSGMITWDITDQEKRLGGVYFDTQYSSLQQKQGNSLTGYLLFFLCMVLIVLIFSFVYCYRTFLYPFHKLQKFASCISDGNFDEPLPMDRYNLFGSFTESFDVMRTSLKEAKQKTIALDKSKKELVASLSHDIRTPVTSINVLLELLLLKYQNDEELKQKLLLIQGKTRQMEELASNLLHSTLEDLEELAVNPVPTSSAVLARLLKESNLEDILLCRHVPDCMIDLDITRTRQIIDNILSNSRKYAGTLITVSFQLERDFLHVCIEDKGENYLPEEMELVCDQYYRGNAALSTGKDGEGLGLYLTKYMILKMNGEMEAYDAHPGFGIRLLFRLS